MPSRKNTAIEAGSIVVSFSMPRALRPNLAVLSKRLNLRSTSEILALVANDVEASVVALQPLAAKLVEYRQHAAEEKVKHRIAMAKFRLLTPEQQDRFLESLLVEGSK